MSPRKRSEPARIETLRQPPQAVDAEQSVLGALMLNDAALAKVRDWISEEDFYRHDHRIIWRAIVDLDEQGKPYDSVTLAEWFEANALADAIDPSYPIQLANTTPSAANVVAYAEIVREKARLRQLIDVGTEIATSALSPKADASNIASAAAAKVGALVGDPRAGGLSPMRSAVAEWWQLAHNRYERGEHLTGIPTPFEKVNEMTQGLQAGDTIIIAGRPSMGKTVLWENLARHAALQGEATALFSMEMRRAAIVQRGVSAMTGIPHEHMRRAWQLTGEDWDQITAATLLLNKAPLWIDDQQGLNDAQIIARAKRLHQQKPLKFVGIDHLGRLRLPGRGNKADEVGDSIKRIQAEAKRHGWVLVILSQLNRNLYGRTDNRPNMGDLRASGAIEEDADVIWFIHREDYYDRNTHLKGVVELIPAKGRDFANDRTIHLANDFSCMRLTDWQGPLPEPPLPPAKEPRKSKGLKANGHAQPTMFGERD